MSKVKLVPVLKNKLVALHENGKLIKLAAFDPDENDNRTLDWTSRLAFVTPDVLETVQSSTWTWVSDLLNDNLLGFFPAFLTPGGVITSVYLTGGTLGNTYKLLNHIITTGGRTLEQTVSIAIRSK